MKLNINCIITLVIAVVFASCQYDNYDEPGILFDGQIVHNGAPIGVSYNDVYFELWEPGWQLKYPINVAVDQDGSFSALLFAADYKLVIPEGQGPYRSMISSDTNSDTINVTLTGNRTMNIEVEPYYMVRNANFSSSGRTVTSTFGLEQIITDGDARDIERVFLYVSKTAFVDTRTSISTSELDRGSIGDLNSIRMSTDVPDLVPAQDDVFARIGVKIAGIEDMLFSAVENIQL
ncbi:MAG: DUF3823 domain-containing protein [Cytophagales bacterium]|nr:DUF3823 domain-containing protein [Cytophagales bacterium]